MMDVPEGKLDYWSRLEVGQEIEVFDGRGIVILQGTVETLALSLGITWIRTTSGDRRLLHIQEDDLRVVR